MLEMAEALEKYTVVQLIAAFPLMLVILLIVREIKSLVTAKSNKPAGGDATQFVLATAIGNISDMLGPKMEAFGDVLKVISNQLVQQTTILQSNDTKATKQTTIIDQTNKAVDIMNNTVVGQSEDIKKILAAIERLEKKFDDLGVEFRDTRKELDNIKADVENINGVTQEAPKVDMQKTLAASAAASTNPQSKVTPQGKEGKTSE